MSDLAQLVAYIVVALVLWVPFSVVFHSDQMADGYPSGLIWDGLGGLCAAILWPVVLAGAAMVGLCAGAALLGRKVFGD